MHAATFTVTNLNDSDSGSLRQAILNANAAADDDIIAFQSGLSGTIALTTGLLLIDSNLTINGLGTSQPAISGNDSLFNFRDQQWRNSSCPPLGRAVLKVWNPY